MFSDSKLSKSVLLFKNTSYSYTRVKHTDFFKTLHFQTLNYPEMCLYLKYLEFLQSVRLSDLYKLLYFQTLNCLKIYFYLKNTNQSYKTVKLTIFFLMFYSSKNVFLFINTNQSYKSLFLTDFYKLPFFRL